MRLVLASASPRRAELLRAAGYTFATLAVDVDERVPPGEAPRDYVRRLAQEKSARAWEVIASSGGPERSALPVVIGADTAVVVDGDILGKPADDDESQRMLERLSGRSHFVLTGVSLRNGSVEMNEVDETEVWFRELTSGEIAWYVASGEGRDKAGGYAIQGLASRFIPRIHGSYSNVVGLPVTRVARLLAELDRVDLSARGGGASTIR
jgi:septum formation protein